jgi:hypothetical protein
MAHVLARFQEQLQSIHGIRIDARVEDFLVDHDGLAVLGVHTRAPEELLVFEEAQGISLGLYIQPEIIQSLSGPNPPLRLLLGRLLPSYCAAAEGVSHWLYVSHRAEREVRVSQLELEVQAEVDKFASCVLGLWQLGLTRLCRLLRERLFDGVRYFAHLDAQERDRYSTANRLARSYARSLERRFVAHRDLDGFLRELRASFRLSGGEKYAHLAVGS